MTTIKEIKAQIRELKRDMKSQGIPLKSCFNGGHSSASLAMNTELFRLKVELDLLEKNHEPNP